MKRLERREATLRAGLLGVVFLVIAIGAAIEARSPLAIGALAVGLVLGAGLMQTFIRVGLAFPGYTATRRDSRATGWGATLGVAIAIFVTGAAGGLIPGALAILPVLAASMVAGLILVIIPNLRERPHEDS